MPVVPHEGHGYNGIIRQVRVVRGSMTFRVECRPAFNYAWTRMKSNSRGGVKFHSKNLHLRWLLTFRSNKKRRRRGRVHSNEGESTSFELQSLSDEDMGKPLGLSAGKP